MLKTSTTVNNLMNALMKAQKTILPVTKSASNPFFKSKYADLNAILDTVTEPLENQGILILQPTVTDGTNNYLVTRLQHVESGEFIESTLKLELKQATMQELGSAVSFARRYTLQSLLRLQAQDDDGNTASGKAIEAKAVVKQAIGLAQQAAAPTTENSEPIKKANGTKKTFANKPVAAATQDNNDW